MEKSKLSAESVGYLNEVSTLLGASKTNVLIDKTFNIVALNVSEVLNSEGIKKAIAENPKLDFMKSEKFIFRGTLTVKLLGDTQNTTVYLNNALLANLKKSGAIEFNVVDNEVIHTITSKAVKLSSDKSELLGNTTTEQ